MELADESTSSRRKDYVFEPFKITQVKCRSSDIPRPRSGHRIVCDDVNIYCFGGYNPNPTLSISNGQLENPTWTPGRPLFRELWSFSIAKRRWKEHKVVENMPDELASNAMCMSGQCLVVFGGTGAPFGNKCNNDVIVWKPSPGAVKLKILDVNGARPPGLYGQAILCYDGYFYTIGGTNGFAYNCDIYRLDLRTKVWESLYVGTGGEDEPMGRYRHEIARFGNKLYIIGGGTGEWAFDIVEIPMFHLDTKKWTLLESKPDCVEGTFIAPFPRKCHSAVQIDGEDGVQVFVAGGSNGQSVFDDVWRLNVPDLTWTLMQKTVLPKRLYFHSSTVTSYGCMYVFGGIEVEENNLAVGRNNNLYKVWLCIPKLSEIAWEALLHFHPYLDQIDKAALLNIGIPSHFMDRLHPGF